MPPPTYETKWSWKSPLTLAVLTWLSVLLGALGVLAGYQGFSSLFRDVLGKDTQTGAPTSSPWIWAFVIVMLLFVLAVGLRQVARHRTQHLSATSLLPALTGWGGRIGLARFKGRCPCGGKLRFYNKPVAWVENLETGKRRITKREMVAECARDPEHHVWRVSAVDGPDSAG